MFVLATTPLTYSRSIVVKISNTASASFSMTAVHTLVSATADQLGSRSNPPTPDEVEAIFDFRHHYFRKVCMGRNTCSITSAA